MSKIPESQVQMELRTLKAMPRKLRKSKKEKDEEKEKEKKEKKDKDSKSKSKKKSKSRSKSAVSSATEESGEGDETEYEEELDPNKFKQVLVPVEKLDSQQKKMLNLAAHLKTPKFKIKL